MPKIVVTTRLANVCATWLDRHSSVVEVREKVDLSPAVLADADGLVIGSYTTVSETLLKTAPNLKVVGRAGVGLDNIDLTACRHRNVAVVHTPEANTQAVCEYIIALMLDAFRPRVNLGPDDDVARYLAYRRLHLGVKKDTL